MSCLAIVAVLAFVAAALPLVGAQFLDPRLISTKACFSTSAPWGTNVLVASQPTDPVDVLVIPTPYSKFEFYCFEIFENGPIISPALQNLCSAPHVYLICTSPVFADAFRRNWTCTDMTAKYATPINTLTIGAQHGPPLWIKAQWWNAALGSACFPMYLTTLAVAKSVEGVNSTVATTIAFAVIGAIVGALALFFGAYQCRKLRAKFGAKRHSLNKPPTAVGFRAGDAGEETEDAAKQKVAGVDLYGEHAIPAAGVQRVELPEEGVILESKPLFKPWYERENFRHPTAALFDQSPLPEQTRALRHRRGASPEQIEFSPGGQQVNRSARNASPTPLRHMDPFVDGNAGGGGGGGGVQLAQPRNEEMVMVCTDCFRALQDPQTPQFCTVTGLRHY